MQKTQAELKGLLIPWPGYTAYIAPPQFRPDLRFRPYAAACHVGWKMPQCERGVRSFAVSIRVDKPTDSTYYMAIGFSGGYCGMQRTWGGGSLGLFSMWEPNAAHPITTTYTAEGVNPGSFGGGEGNGGTAHSYGDADDEATHLARFDAGEEITFLIRAARVDQEYTAFALMRHSERHGWEHYATHVTWVEEKNRAWQGRLTGLHSFIEAMGAEYGLVARSGIWKAWGQENAGDDWFPVTQVSGSCTMDGYGDASYGNTRVGPHDGGVEMCTGGPRLADGRGCEIYEGQIDHNSVPAHILAAPWVVQQGDL